MWDCTRKMLNDGRAEHFTLLQDGSPIPYLQVLADWQHEPDFRVFFSSLLSG